MSRIFAFIFLFIAHTFYLVSSSEAASGPGNKDPKLAKKVTEIFEAQCTKCHEGKDAEAGVRILDFEQVFKGSGDSGNALVNTQQPEQSLLYQQIISKDGAKPAMPKGKKGSPLSTTDANTVLDWIKTESPSNSSAKSIAKGGASKAERKFISNREMEKYMSDYLEGLKPEEAEDTTFLTLTHLYNREAPQVSDEELESHRQALSKTVNSLSSESKIVIPKAIDPARTIFAIRGKDYGWNPGTWEYTILKPYPYAIFFETVLSKQIRTNSGSSVPYVRGDWFVARATKPPMYHSILRIPRDQKGLERDRAINVDVANNIEHGLVDRAGFRGKKFNKNGGGSRVSENNRGVEHHKTKNGSLWISYDFGTNEGDHDLLENPLGPGTGPLAFKQDGGEIIYNLPNGFQAYMIVNGKGKRIDSAPINVVRDYTHNQEAVVNGLSCISCHSEGMNRNYDQVLPFIKKLSSELEPKDVQRIESLYKTKSELDKIFDADNARFRKALDLAGVTVDKEPISRLAQEFENPVSEVAAAAELGLSVKDFESQLEAKGYLKPFQALFETGGVSRESFIDVYAKLIEILEIGKPVLADKLQFQNLADPYRITDARKDLELLFPRGPLHPVYTSEKRFAAQVSEIYDFLDAVYNGELSKVKSFIAGGLNLKIAKTDTGDSPLNEAMEGFCDRIQESEEGNPSVIEFLISRGEDINFDWGLLHTPLIHAASHGCIEGVNLMLRHGATVNSSADYSLGPIFFVVLGERNGALDDKQGAIVSNILLKAGANPNLNTLQGSFYGANKGSTALDILKSAPHDFPLTRRVLEQAGAR